ncbi:amino acid adenylation domain-containing protein [Streptomyces sp. NPDC051569]|uniref:amino acid adenylation domain-containing protein n=1 Tax=Streptomyces sp. NPDC051569 TaxID=3365661 RepID=UPI00379A71D8
MSTADSGLFLDMLLRQFTATPGSTAVELGDQRLTYAELDAASQRLAARLSAAGAAPDTTVGVFLESSLQLAVAVVAVIRSGAAWLPLDPSYPQDRLEYMIEDSGTRLLVADPREAGRLAGTGIPVVDPADDAAGAPDAAPGTAPVLRPTAGSAAYVIYTSGSTGRPKGVTLTQRGLANLAEAQVATFGLEPGKRVLQFASPSFDASVFELAMALCSGATLVQPPRRDVLYGPGLGEFLRAARITHLTLPPSVLGMVPETELPDLELIVCAGEALPARLVERWGTGRRMINAYGPTEATVWASLAETRPGGGKPVIGHAVQGVRLQVLDETLRPVPQGEPGELVIGGAGVARGYIGRPGLTADRFAPDPEVPGERVYRTGDLVRLTEDGELDFLGRIDQQVKLNGFRIEPDEAAGVLREHPGVHDVAVVVGQVGDEDRLLAYAVAPGTEPRELREFAGARLPHYMVPTIVMIERLPLTPNGKLDRAALPAPDRASLGMRADEGAARTPTERRLAKTVAELLGLTEVGVDDDFFVLGGHSLLAGRLAAQIRADFGAELPISRIYERPTVAAMAAALDRPGGTAPALPPVGRARRDQPLPLSFPQERIWFLEELSPGNLAYNAQATIRLRGTLDVAALDATFTEIVRRHEVLRTAFTTVDGVPVQEPRPPMPVEVPLLDLTDVTGQERERRTDEAVRETIGKPFDLTDPPLLRWLLIRYAADDHTLVQVEHHFVHDGWSFAMLLDEVRAIYPELAAGRPSPLPEPAVQYVDFAAWQRDWMRDEVLTRHLDHWTTTLEGAPLTLDLPTDRPRPRNQSFEGAAVRIDLPATLSRRLRETSHEAGVTLFASMLSGFTALLGRYAGVTDVVVGTGAANRRLAETERMLGMVVNTLPLRVDMSGSPDFDELRKRVHDIVVTSSDWQDVPLDRLVKAVAPPRDQSRNPLFQVMFSFHNAAVPDLDFGGIEGTVLERHNGTAKMDLNIVVIPRAQQRTGREDHPDGERITLIWEYSTALFDEETMRRMVDHYVKLLDAALGDPTVPMDRIGMLSGVELGLVTEGWNGTVGDFPGGCLHELVDARAVVSPDAVAVVGVGGECVTFAELVGRANALAVRLVGLGVGPDVPVGLWLDRSVEMVVALLGILKAGGAFVPLDPDVPAGRAVSVLSGGGVPLVCTDAERAVHFVGSGVGVVDCGVGLLGDVAESGPSVRVLPDHLVSLYFTSGSTGVPKAVASTHRGWVNRMWWMQEHHGLEPGDAVLHKTILSFDDSAVELFWPLMVGGRVVLLGPGLHRDPRAIVRAAADGGAVALHFVPSMLALFLDEVTPALRERLSGLRHVISSGEALRPDLVGRFYDRFVGVGARLHNQWGATEVSIDSTVHTCVASEGSAGSVPIGLPITNNQLFVLDRYMNPVPVGVPGDLYLAGVGLARGYWGDARKTAAVFVPSPFVSGERLYRTGDQGIRRADGAVTFLGRVDHQIKVRGIRIEPGEIEHALCAHPDVDDAVVTKWEPAPGDQRLAAYLKSSVSEVEFGRVVEEVLADLALRLPPYLIPASFTPVDVIPTNANGKTDVRRLPVPRAVESAGSYTPAGTETELLVAGVWADVLGVQDPDIHTSFFTLGGHSLLATKAIARLRTALDLDLPLVLLFDNPTIHTMAEAVEAVLLRDLEEAGDDPAEQLLNGQKEMS